MSAYKRHGDHRAAVLDACAVVFLRSVKKIAEKSAQGVRDTSLYIPGTKLKFIQKKLVSPETTG
jgi:hypothetical protein